MRNTQQEGWGHMGLILNPTSITGVGFVLKP